MIDNALGGLVLKFEMLNLLDHHIELCLNLLKPLLHVLLAGLLDSYSHLHADLLAAAAHYKRTWLRRRTEAWNNSVIRHTSLGQRQRVRIYMQLSRCTVALNTSPCVSRQERSDASCQTGASGLYILLPLASRQSNTDHTYSSREDIVLANVARECAISHRGKGFEASAGRLYDRFCKRKNLRMASHRHQYCDP